MRRHKGLKVLPRSNSKAQAVKAPPRRNNAWLLHAVPIGSAIKLRVDGDAPTDSPEGESGNLARKAGTLVNS